MVFGHADLFSLLQGLGMIGDVKQATLFQVCGRRWCARIGWEKMSLAPAHGSPHWRRWHAACPPYSHHVFPSNPQHMPWSHPLVHQANRQLVPFNSEASHHRRRVILIASWCLSCCESSEVPPSICGPARATQFGLEKTDRRTRGNVGGANQNRSAVETFTPHSHELSLRVPNEYRGVQPLTFPSQGLAGPPRNRERGSDDVTVEG